MHGLTLGFLSVKLTSLVVNAYLFPALKPARSERPDCRRVSLLIPARNEAHSLVSTLPTLLAQGALEVIVLDDQSEDGTAEVAQQLGARVVEGQPLPAGWVGKSWACHQLAQHARGDILIFVDADVVWHSGALSAVLTELERSGAGLLSVFPRQNNVTLGERLITPQVDSTLLGLFPAPLLTVPHAAAAVANGQVMAFQRATYERLGGHRCVKGELLEDVVFSRLVKSKGERLGLALGQTMIGVRMYRSYPESVRGFAKSILPMHGGKRSLLVANVGLQLLVYTVPALRVQKDLVALALAEAMLVRVLTKRTQPAELAEVLLTPVLPLFYLPVAWLSLRREAVWKGRRYVADGQPSAAP